MHVNLITKKTTATTTTFTKMRIAFDSSEMNLKLYFDVTNIMMKSLKNFDF